jgi:hypothetical protein
METIKVTIFGLGHLNSDLISHTIKTHRFPSSSANFHPAIVVHLVIITSNTYSRTKAAQYDRISTQRPEAMMPRSLPDPIAFKRSPQFAYRRPRVAQYIVLRTDVF